MIRSEREIMKRLAATKEKLNPKWGYAYDQERLWGFKAALEWVLEKKERR